MDDGKPENLSNALRLILVDDDQVRAAAVEEGLLAKGFEVLSVIPTAAGLLYQLAQLEPDAVIISLDSPDRDILESLSIASAHNPRPVVMFSESGDEMTVTEDGGRVVTYRYNTRGYLVDEIIVDPVEEGDAADEGPVEVIPALEQCDAADYRPMIGTPVAAATFPQDDMLRIYAVNDIITQEYLPQRTNIVVGLDGLIQRVTCG